MSSTSSSASRRRLLLTGGTGFIGRRLTQEAGSRGYLVRALVRTRGSGEDLGAAELFEGDLLEPQSLVGIERDVDVVIHGAGILGKWGTDQGLVRRVNAEAVVHLLNRFQGQPPAHFLHLSAGGVTGPVPQREVDESYECQPATEYERSKLEGERSALAVGEERGIPVTVLRPTFTYGPGDPHKLALFRAVQRGKFAFIGRGNSVLHPVFIDDLVRGILDSIDRARSGEIYIIGGSRPISKRELIHTIADALRVPRPRLWLPRMLAWPTATLLEAIGRGLGFEPILTRGRVMMMADNFGYSIAKARRELGYAPQVELDEGIRRTIEAYRQANLLAPEKR